MVDNGIVQKLMDLLDRHVEDGNVTVQHAALSALRNLAIPGKPRFALLITQRWNSVFSLYPARGWGWDNQLMVLEAGQTAAFHSGQSLPLCLLQSSGDKQFEIRHRPIHHPLLLWAYSIIPHQGKGSFVTGRQLRRPWIWFLNPFCAEYCFFCLFVLFHVGILSLSWGSPSESSAYFVETLHLTVTSCGFNNSQIRAGGRLLE